MRWTAPFPSSLSLSSLSLSLSSSHHLLTILHTLPPSSFLPSISLLPFPVPPSLPSPLPPFPSLFHLFLLKPFPSLTQLLLTSLQDSSNFSLSFDILAHFKKPIPPRAFSLLISASASQSPEKSLHTFSLMPHFNCRPDPFTYNTVLHILVNNNVLILALAVYNQMLKSGCSPNDTTFLILIHGLCKDGRIEDARKMFEEMERRGVVPGVMVYTVILRLLWGKGMVEEAKGLFESMRQRRKRKCRGVDEVAYNVMLSGFCRSGRVDEAVEELRGYQREGFVIGLNGYSCLIDGLFRVDRFEDACRVYKEMLGKGIQPDCVLYTIMIRGFSEVGRVDEAFGILKEMGERGIVPDTYCYNTLIKGFCDAGRLDQAGSLRLEISKNGLFPDSTTYTIMICRLCKNGLILDAEKIFEEMEKVGCVPTVMTFNALIDGLCKAGDLKKALLHLCEMEMGRKPSLFLRLSQGVNRINDPQALRKRVEEMCEAGDVVKAYKLLRDIIDSGMDADVVTYNTLMNGLLKARDPEGALNLYKRLQFKGLSPDEVTFGTLIDGLLKIHRDKDADIVYQHMVKNGHSPSLSICNSLMVAHCRRKKVSQAVSLWLAHISKAITTPNEAETIKAMENHFEQGNLEEAIKGLIKMDKARGSVDCSPYTIWLIGFCQARQTAEALKIFTILTEFDIEVTLPSCALLIQSLCWERKLSTAVDVMRYALRRGRKGFFLMQPVGNRLLKKLCLANMRKDAHELVWRMSLTGYDVDNYLRVATKRLLYNRNTVDVEVD